MSAKEMFEKLDIQLVNEKTLIYKQDDGGYVTEYLFNNITQCVQIKEYELFNYNKPQGSTTLSIELLQAINKQVEELGWNNVKNKR